MIADDAIGCAVAAIDTPALLVDRDALSANIAAMATFAAGAGLSFRPHAKAHKCPEIARLQLAAGAVGICCQKLSEAEAVAGDGIDDVLIANEVVGVAKWRRLADFALRKRVTVVVDNLAAAEGIAAAARAAGASVGVLIDVDLGQNRCGVTPAEALPLARAVAALDGLVLRGLQGYQGKLQHIEGFSARAAAADAAHAPMQALREDFAAAGLSTEIVTGAGTGTYDTPGVRRTFTEIQAGSYIFMDAHYRRVGGRSGPVYDDFAPALTVLATVMSTPTADRVVVDAGMKSLSTDSGLPVLLDIPGWTYTVGGDEHGILIRTGEGPAPRLGEVVRILPSHCDTTVNLFDRFHVVSGGRLVDIWDIPGRGRTR